MPSIPGEQLLGRLRRALGKEAGGGLSDADLVRKYVQGQDEGAFALLVQRHGCMVWGLCQSLLQQRQDAEDVFQATFLVLARSAASVRDPRALASWLHGVAFRLAQKLRRQAHRRPARTGENLEDVPARPMDELTWRELRQVLHEELTCLPERNRLPLMLCHLEGLTQDEAARRLGWTAGQLRGRLLRGRELLRDRLVRRGLDPAAPLLAVALSRAESLAALPATLPHALWPVARAWLLGDGPAGPASGTPLRLAEKFVRGAPGLNRRLLLSAALALCLAGGAVGWLVTGQTPRPVRPAPAVKDKAQEQPLPQVDGLGDPLPPGALVRLGSLRFRHGGYIGSLVFSPDGKTLTCGGWDSRIRRWEADGGKELPPLDGPREGLGALALSADGGRLVGAGMDGNLHVWDPKSGRKLRQWPARSGALEALAVTPDGRYAVTGGRHKDARFWDLEAGKELRPLGKFKREINSVALSPDGKLAALSSYEGHARVVDTATGQELYRLHPDRQAYYCLAFAPDGQTLLTGETGAACLWEVKAGKLLRRTDELRGNVYGALFAPDGKTFATGSYQAVQTWDARTGKELHRFEGHTDSVRALAFSADGRRLASGCNDGSVHLWDARNGGPWGLSPGHQERVSHIAFSPDGRAVATAAWDRTVRLWDARTGRQTLKLTWPVTADERQVGLGYVRSLGFSPDGKGLAVATDTDKVLLWRLPGTEPVVQGEGGWASFSPDGRHLAAGGTGRIARLYEVSTGREVRRFRGHLSAIAWVGFSPDGRTPVTVSRGVHQGLGEGGQRYDRDTIWLWDVATGEKRRAFGGGNGPVVAALSTDGRTLAATGGRREAVITLWELATGRERCQLQGLDESPRALAFSPDSKLLASGGTDKTIRLWQLPSGREAHRLRGHRGPVLALAFARDGKRLVSGSLDTTGLVWRVPEGGGVEGRPGDAGRTSARAREGASFRRGA
jgi:RNA polymerase sigma factor (sigma-70 family)